MKLTKALREHFVEHKGLSADATDEELRKAAAAALADESLSHDEYMDLSKDPDADSGNKLLDMLGRMDERLKSLETPKPPEGDKSGDTNDDDDKSTPKRSYVDKFLSGASRAELQVPGTPTVRQVGAHERYDKSREELRYPETIEKHNTVMRHPLAGRKVFEGGSEGRREIRGASELDTAMAGAYFRWALHSESKGNLPQVLKLTDHDVELIQYALHNEKWAGVIHGIGSDQEGAIAVKNRKLTEFEIKAVLDDSTSGGLEVAPIVFDDQIILTPLLHGEFFPRVNVVNITRGRRIEGASMANVTINSAGADGTAIDLENTANFITAFDTTIFVADGAIELGMDFMSDSPVDNGALIVQSYGEQMLAWLDEQICIGDGTTEPEGVTNASGTTTVNADNGAGGPPTVGDLESLLFGVSKAYKRGAQAGQIAYGMNETSYQRARGIAVGSSDARRVFGMSHEDYMLFNRQVGINEQFTNRQQVFGHFGRYRMYRRLGLTIKSTSEGKELVRNNLLLISARSRWGGQVEDGSAFAVEADGQS